MELRNIGAPLWCEARRHKNVKNTKTSYLIELYIYFIVGMDAANTGVSFAQKLKIFLHTI